MRMDKNKSITDRINEAIDTYSPGVITINDFPEDEIPLVEINYDLNVTCDTGAFGFMENLAKSAGEDLVYSLALEKGNLFMCVTAFPSMTKKRFDTEGDGMRAIFLIDQDEYELSQSVMIDNLTKMINDHIYYEDELDGLPSSAREALLKLADSMDETTVRTESDDKNYDGEPSPGHGS